MANTVFIVMLTEGKHRTEITLYFFVGAMRRFTELTLRHVKRFNMAMYVIDFIELVAA